MRLKKYFLIPIFLVSVIVNYGQGFICAVGGGSEDYNDWSDEPYGWIVEKADSGKIVVLSYSSSTWYPGYFTWLGASECVNIIIDSRTVAELQSTYDSIVSATGVFIVGGDQFKYVSYWKDTKTEDAVKQVFSNGGVIAGTSAGAMVLSEFVFTAQNGSAMSKQSLLNPFNNRIQLDNDFLKLTPDAIFDTHYIERGRFGRLIAFVFNAYSNYMRSILGVGIDDKTAICIDDNGIGTVHGTGAVTFIHIDENTNVENNSNGYMLENLACDKLVDGWKYDFINREVYEIPPSASELDTTRTWELTLTDLQLTGSDNLQTNINSSLPLWLNGSDLSNLLIITDPGFTPQPIFDYLNSQSISYNFIELNSTSITDQSIADKISQSSSIIFAGDDLHEIAELRDETSLAGAAFYAKVHNSIPLYLLGSSGKLSSKFYTDNVDDYYLAAYKGQMTTEEGLNIFGDLIFQPRIFEHEDYYENRISSVEWGMMHNRKRLGLFLDVNDHAEIDKAENTITVFGSMPTIILDARNSTYIDSSTYVVSGGSAPRQVIAMNNLRYNISNLNRTYSIESGKFLETTPVEELKTEINNSFELFENYPNPFNPTTKIKFVIPADLSPHSGGGGLTTLKVFDLLGREISTLVSVELSPGNYEVEFDGSRLSSGVYFYSLKSGDFNSVKKMMLIK